MNPIQRAHSVITSSTAFASNIGVDLIVEWQDEQGRLAFVIERQTGSLGAGAKAIAFLLRQADLARLPVVIDVIQSQPRLIQYYWQFGFACQSSTDQNLEQQALDDIKHQRDAYIKRGSDIADFGVTFMWRTVDVLPLGIAA